MSPPRPGLAPSRPVLSPARPGMPQPRGSPRPAAQPISSQQTVEQPNPRPMQPPLQPPAQIPQPTRNVPTAPLNQPSQPPVQQAPGFAQPFGQQSVGDLSGQMSGMSVASKTKRVYPSQPGVNQPPAPISGGQQPVTQGFQQPATQSYQQPATQGFQQPATQGFQQPPTQGFQQPPTQGFQQPPTQGFQQPVGSSYQQANAGFQQPSFAGANGLPQNPSMPPGPGFQPVGGIAPGMRPGMQHPQPGFQTPNGFQNPGGLAGPAAAAPRPRIDPDQIPSPIAVQESDQAIYNSNAFLTLSKDLPPLANTRFTAMDQGNCNPRFMRSTLYNVPTSDEIHKVSGIPLGLIVQPLADLDPTEAPIPVVDFGKTGPCRCARCYAYVNPNFRFCDGGRRFACNICGHVNEVSPEYFSNLDMNGRRIDVNERPELLFGSCEFAVDGQYCARPPVPLNYLFVIDVSWPSIQSGMLATFASSIKHYLYSGQFSLPVGTKVGFVTFDRALHFYNLNENLDQYQMMIVADMEDVFAPMQQGLCVDPMKSKNVIEMFLDALPTMFMSSKISEAALGSACMAAFEALKPTGGRISLFQTSLPTFGMGSLKNREDVKILGTDKERSLYEPQEYFWKKLGQDCASNGVGVDSYLFANQYVDLATIGALSALTGGETHLYGSFDANRHGMKFANDLHRTLSRTYGYDGLLRVRVSTGLKVAEYFGNVYMKNSTDVEIAGMDSLKAIGVALGYDGKLDERSDVYVQAAFLYTTSEGHRRVRVHNLALGIASQQSNIFRKAEMDTIISFLTRTLIQESFTAPLKTLRDRLSLRCIKILAAYRSHCAASSSPGQLILPESLKLLPLYTLCVLKSRAIRGGKLVPADLRVYTMRLLNSLGIAENANYMYPRIYNLSEYDTKVGELNEHNLVQLPPILRCSQARLDPTGIYLAENGRHLFLWIGQSISESTLNEIFGVNQLSQVDSRSTELAQLSSPRATQLSKIIAYLRSIRYRFMQLTIVRQGLDPQNEVRFSNLMLEDANLDNMSYVDYLCSIHLRDNLPPHQATFHVPKSLNKFDIKQLLEKMYQIDITDIRTMNYLGKKGKSVDGRVIGGKAGFKKAIVTMKEDFIFPAIPTVKDDGAIRIPPNIPPGKSSGRKFRKEIDEQAIERGNEIKKAQD